METIIGKTLRVYDIASQRDLPFVNEYLIESFEAYKYIQLKDYPTKTYIFDDEEWDNLLNKQKAWIHPAEVFCTLI